MIRIFGVPMDLGQRRRGVDMGPSALRYAGLQPRLERLGLEVCDGGNVAVPVIEEISQATNDDRMHNAEAISKVCHDVHDLVRRALAAGEQVITLGGDHSIALGTVSAALMQNRSVGVLWIDAHGDFNTPQTTPSGNVHGMVVTSLMGMSPAVLTIGEVRLRPEQIVQIGIRDLDAEEKVALAHSGIKVMTMREIDERGMAEVVRATLQILGDADALHISLDMDALDPKVTPGVGTPVPGGLTYREAHLLLEMLADDGRVRSLDIVEVNPILDERNETAHVAVELAASLFGSRIL
ncbi:MAG TPA: arginase [Phototrophicaceae bacterium]|nr:arginase [Phototrophicaceae bacterium]